MVYKRVRGWTSGRSIPVLNFVKYPPTPPGIEHDDVQYYIVRVGGIGMFRKGSRGVCLTYIGTFNLGKQSLFLNRKK